WVFQDFAEGDQPDTTTVVNTLPYRRRGLVELPGREPEIVELEGFAGAVIGPPPARGIKPAPGTRIESDRFVLEAMPDGTLTLTDKTTGRRYERLHGLEDEPDVGDLYNFCPVEDAAVWRAERTRTRILSNGPLVWE